MRSGIRKRSRVLWKITPLSTKAGQHEYYLWRTEKCKINREYIIMATGLDVNRYGAETQQQTFRVRRK